MGLLRSRVAHHGPVGLSSPEVQSFDTLLGLVPKRFGPVVPGPHRVRVALPPGMLLAPHAAVLSRPEPLQRRLVEWQPTLAAVLGDDPAHSTSTHSPATSSRTSIGPRSSNLNMSRLVPGGASNISSARRSAGPGQVLLLTWASATPHWLMPTISQAPLLAALRVTAYPRDSSHARAWCSRRRPLAALFRRGPRRHRPPGDHGSLVASPAAVRCLPTASRPSARPRSR